ncbi:hypothetical protein M430DRAFT_25282 [Amorphotheca resinae ATCC 22711]|jgi:Uma2 family endonuclease|uniref:Uncharacterized protein n=1 Tax=Amorphotheca resinae ATCC 22711 TaxID=857342 RepID=A0A2T3BAY7_AMORE|nr:hypothetical protein M430DRAFT_25282 [Amorphotheca resinae ATCC 22711]PSS25491.1 hypothetical protein M430DRAFT_25282 [Amorphotheca resinae ATCC 22711]
MTSEPPTGSGVDPEWLSDVEAEFHFTDRDNLARTLRAFFYNALDRDPLCDHTALVTGFPIESFDIDEDDYDAVDDESAILRHRKALYLTDSKTLILTMPSRPHEEASRRLDILIASKQNNMNCEDELSPTGRWTIMVGNVCKEPDASWAPREANYPTLVVESLSAVSESSRALGRDAKIWLENDDSHVTQVITIKIHRTRPEIVFTLWRKAPEGTDTQTQHPPRAVVDQVIDVTLEEGRPMADGNLCLSFEKIFERRPRPGTTEGDLVFSARELGGIARGVWKAMGFAVLQ